MRRYIVTAVATIVTALGLALLTSKWIERQSDAELVALAERSSVAIDLKFEIWKRAASDISQSYSMIRAFNVDILRWQAERIASGLGGWAALAPLDDLTKVLFHTRIAPGTVIADSTVRPEAIEVVQRSRVSGKPEISNVFEGPVSLVPIVTVANVVTASDGRDYVVFLVFPVRQLSVDLEEAPLPEGDFIGIVDGTNRIVARSRDIERFMFKPLPDWFVTAARQGPPGLPSIIRGPGVNGTTAVGYTFARNTLEEAPGWAVSVAAPQEVIPATGLYVLIPLIGAGLVLLGLGTIERQRSASQRSQAALQTARDQTVRERALRADLEHALQDLRDAEEARRNMLGVLGHEMRTPVLAAMAAIHLLPETVKSAESRGHLALAEKGLKALQSLIEDILDLTRLSAGEFRLNQDPFPLDSLLQDAADILTPMADRHRLQFRQDWPQDAPIVVGDRDRLRQILINLLSNAFRHTRAGTVTLRGSWSETPLGLCHIRLCVEDTGPGISEEDMAHLFKPFFCGRMARGNRISGLGLGLSIAERLARAMGGMITVSSRLGEGSTFCVVIDLPLSQAAPQLVLPPAAIPVPAAELKALVVEDHPVQATMVASVLAAMHLRTYLAATGQEALDAAAEDRFDLIMIDLGLPDISGVEVARALRAQGSAAIHIAFSANPASLNADERKLFDLIAQKSGSVADLQALIQAALSLRQTQGKLAG